MIFPIRHRGGKTLVLAGLLAILAGCGRQVERSMVPPSDFATLDSESPFLKAHLANGGVYVFYSWGIDSTGAAIQGAGTLLDVNREVVTGGEFRLPADSVVLFETNVESASGPSKALTLMAGITGIVAAVCLSNPKSCFGSCPTFYAPGRGGEMELQAEGFSSSIAPALEATDVDMLLHAQPGQREFTIRVTNEAFETHVIRQANVLAVQRPDEGRVFLTSSGAFFETSAPKAPRSCSASEGDCLAKIAQADGDERASLADSTDLATREFVDLEFEGIPGEDLGLVLVTRQTLMTTFLIYQALAYMGTEAGRWLAALETGGEEAVDRAGGVGRLLGGVEVMVPGASGDWIVVGQVGETGPIATDTRIVRLPNVSAGPVRVRLRMTQGLWRLDKVGLVALGSEVEPVRVSPTEVTRDQVEDQAAFEALTDPEKTLVTLPGDALDVTYQLPEHPETYDLFLEARGYYLEWMRQEWMAEEDPIKAAQLILDPAGALRSLAPLFKEEEPRIEGLFWGSRYVRN